MIGPSLTLFGGAPSPETAPKQRRASGEGGDGDTRTAADAAVATEPDGEARAADAPDESDASESAAASGMASQPAATPAKAPEPSSFAKLLEPEVAAEPAPQAAPRIASEGKARSTPAVRGAGNAPLAAPTPAAEESVDSSLAADVAIVGGDAEGADPEAVAAARGDAAARIVARAAELSTPATPNPDAAKLAREAAAAKPEAAPLTAETDAPAAEAPVEPEALVETAPRPTTEAGARVAPEAPQRPKIAPNETKPAHVAPAAHAALSEAAKEVAPKPEVETLASAAPERMASAPAAEAKLAPRTGPETRTQDASNGMQAAAATFDSGPTDPAAPVIDRGGVARIDSAAAPQPLHHTGAAAEARAAHVSAQIGLAIRADRTGDRIELRLDPPELGRVSIHFTANDGGLSAVVSADRADVAELMRRHSETLLRELQNAGYRSVSLEFGQSGGGAQREGSGAAGAGMAAGGGDAPAESRTEPQQAGLYRRPVGPSDRLDIRL